MAGTDITSKNKVKTKSKKDSSSGSISTIDFLQVKEIRDSVVILNENEMRCVIAVSSANFALKSTEEQNQIIGAFQGILNSIDFPMQIVLQSRKLDLNTYIENLKKLEYQQQNDLLRLKMQEYIAYIEALLSEYNIMNKDFYVVVGIEPFKEQETILTQIRKVFQPTKFVKQDRETFTQNRKQLLSRVDNISSKLNGIDLKTELLNTELLIALFYKSYNPDEGSNIQLGKISDLNIDY